MTKKSEAFSNTYYVESLVSNYEPKDILNYCLEILANTKLEKLENEGKLHYTTTQQKDSDQRITELMNTIRELDAKHKQEVAGMKKEFTREKNSIINAKNQESINQLEIIEEVEEPHDSDGLQIENNTLFNKLEEERKKNSLLEETLRSMRKKFKDEIDGLNVKNTELKSS